MAKYAEISQMEDAASKEADNTVSMRLHAAEKAGYAWLRVVSFDDGSIVHYVDTKHNSSIISREEAQRFIDYETKNFYFVKIYQDDEGEKKFAHVVFNKVEAIDKDEARIWGVEMARALGINHPSVHVEFDHSRPAKGSKS